MAVTSVQLASRLSSILVQKILEESSLVSNFREDLELICDEFHSVKCLLNDARGATNSSSMSNWLQKLQDFVDDAVDLLEDTSQQHNTIISRYLVGRKIRLSSAMVNRVSVENGRRLSGVLLKVGRQIGVLKDRIQRIRASSKYHSGVLMDGNLVGMEEDINQIFGWLSTNDPRIISVTGMGGLVGARSIISYAGLAQNFTGLGKSLPLKLVFDSQKIKETFEHRIWVEVSQSFSVQQLLLHIASEIKIREDKRQIHLSENVLKDNIRSHLQGSGCLLVLDDVWNTAAKRLIFSNDLTVMISTRDKEVAQKMGAQHTYEMDYLSEENSWRLFCMHAFPDDNNHSPPEEMEEVARAIERKCSRLPLTVKTVAASMANVSRLPNQWESTLNRLNQVSTIRDDVLPILRLSFDALPDYLKQCFLFCSAYPENTRMGCEYLIQVWISEGFVNPEETQDPYELGKNYLNQLADRSMIEFVPHDGRHDMIKYCKMHDLLHELALLESQKQTKCLYQAGRNLKEFPVEKCRGLRRISLIKNEITTVNKSIPSPGLRTLLLWKNLKLKSISRRFLSKLRRFRVLDVSQTAIGSLPRSIAKLTHLKLLNLSRTEIKKLPNCLSALTNLLFLDVSECKNLTTLHSGVAKHQCLLHLNTEGCEKLEFLPSGVSKLVSLRKLGQVVFKKDAPKALQLMDLKDLSLLQQLSIEISGSQSLKKGIFGEMTQMRKLFFSNSDDHIVIHLPDDMSSMTRLEILHLHNCVLPTWISQLHNIMVLLLKGDHSANYRPLLTLPNLQRLILSQNNHCTEFPSEFGMYPSFPKLEIFEIEDFSLLRSFPSVNEDAMPKLKYFRLKNCSQLKGLPEGLDQLKSLQELQVVGIEACRTDLQENGFYWNHFKQHNIKLSCE
ncbi:hypothetical protein SUGI_0797070 [Cryptomeria japonica]|nr:hypothetical protein SUGI_0797070 [Cryptomeria japonica]